MYMITREKGRRLGRLGAVTVILLMLTLALSGCGSLLGSSDYAVTVSPSGAESDESVSADVSEAAEGDTVTLTASLNSGREVTLSTDASGVTIDPTTITSDGGTATFTMPATDVTVNATFSTQVPDKVPEASEGAVTGDAYTYMVVLDGPKIDGGGYTTGILLSANPVDLDADPPDPPETYLQALLYDGTDSADIDPGMYSYVAEGDADWRTDGTFDRFVLIDSLNAETEEFDYGASVDGPSDGDAAPPDNFDLITDGTITVSKDGDTYTIDWEMTTDDGETLVGSYTGAVDGVDQP